MRVARDSANHQRLAHRIALDENPLNRREPALINLPISLAKLPLLDPIVTPLIAGLPPASSAAAPTAPSAPSPSSPSNSGGNSGGNSGSNSGGTGSGSSGSPPTSGSSPSSGNSGNSGTSGNTGGGNTGGGTGNTAGGNTGGNSAGSSNGQGSSSSNPSSSPSSSSSSSGGNAGGNAGSPEPSSSRSSPSSSASASGSHSGSQSNTGSSLPVVVSAGGSGNNTGSTFASSPGGQSDESPGNVVNVGSDPSAVSASHGNAASSLPSGHAASTAGVGSQSGGTTAASPGSGGGDGGGGGSISAGDAPSSSHGLSTGALAGIVVSAVVAFAIIFVLCLRRRYITRRAQRRTKWAGQGISSDSLNWNQGNGVMGNGTMSARSSFATTYDISNDSIRGGDVPALPPMAEVRDLHSPGFMTHTQQMDYHDATLISPTTAAAVNLINLDDGVQRRNSGSSKRSSGSSDPYSQYLVIREPPEAITGGNAGHLPLTPLTPMSVRPFSPSESFTFPKPPKSPQQTPLVIDTNLVDTSVPIPAINPFLDTQAEFEETEVIRRPFVPTLDDEMRVSVGERVKVVQVFSDGWTLIERRAVDDKKGKGTSSEGATRGLIPVDCFREAGQELPAFLAAKRVTGNYYQGVAA